MTTRADAARSEVLLPLLRAAHPGPTLAVTSVVALLAAAQEVPVPTAIVLSAAVFAGQLTIGWGNDLLDVRRDRQVGRPDKPLVTSDLAPAVVRRWLVAAACACVVLSLLAGWRSGMTHLALGVTAGHLYNLRLKATPWSWLPYAVACGALPAVVSLAASPPRWPPTWMVGAAAMLGVAAHLVNALPDLDDDRATGVRGLPHRLGAARSRFVATALLVGASVLVVYGPAGDPPAWAGAALTVVVALAALALVGRGRTPFRAAVAIALLDVAGLVVVTA